MPHKGPALASPCPDQQSCGKAGNKEKSKHCQKQLLWLPGTCSVDKASRFHDKEANGQQSLCRTLWIFTSFAPQALMFTDARCLCPFLLFPSCPQHNMGWMLAASPGCIAVHELRSLWLTCTTVHTPGVRPSNYVPACSYPDALHWPPWQHACLGGDCVTMRKPAKSPGLFRCLWAWIKPCLLSLICSTALISC